MAVERAGLLIGLGETLKLNITERLVFKKGASMLSSVRLEAVDRVAIAVGKEIEGKEQPNKKAMVEVIHHGGEVDQGRVDFVEQALEKAGVVKGRIRSRVVEEPTKSSLKGLIDTSSSSCSFRVIQGKNTLRMLSTAPPNF